MSRRRLPVLPFALSLAAAAACVAPAASAATAPPAQPAPAPSGAAAKPEKPQADAPAPAPAPQAAPAPPVRNIGGPGDFPLRERLVQRLTKDPDLTGFRPAVALVNGGVIFSGASPSWTMRRRVLALAGAMRGVINVTDQMTTPRGDIKDQDLVKAIASALSERKDVLELQDLDVTVQDGMATLRGTVKNFAMRVRGEEIAGTVLGATIVNRLRPANTPTPSGTEDASIRKALATYLGDFREYPYPGDLQVQVKDGIAILTGDVGLYLGRQQAGTMAALVGGVKGVDNRIKVDPSLQVPNTLVKEIQ
ncbi:MAG TPA: BON domain-containing protein [Candidatus Polarisedimenticolia bacterium]|jgi:osmotically-inducible protein OsmY|nr:BON domain-containing protein [Candidatus Polarisedimenticolia bacterium]